MFKYLLKIATSITSTSCHSNRNHIMFWTVNSPHRSLGKDKFVKIQVDQSSKPKVEWGTEHRSKISMYEMTVGICISVLAACSNASQIMNSPEIFITLQCSALKNATNERSLT